MPNITQQLVDEFFLFEQFVRLLDFANVRAACCLTLLKDVEGYIIYIRLVCVCVSLSSLVATKDPASAKRVHLNMPQAWRASKLIVGLGGYMEPPSGMHGVAHLWVFAF